MEFIAVFVTAPSREEGENIGRRLVEEKLAACANLVPGIFSVYRWKGAVETAAEVLLILKTERTLLDEVVARVKAMHSYEVPEVVALPLTGGSSDYMKWLEESVRHPL
jgi:periplasmic divalent cation tolerance protein